MQSTTFVNTRESMDVVVDLHSHHRRFHSYLDKLAASSNDLATIELLIEIRKYNVDCISKYSGLISKGKIQPNPLASTKFSDSITRLREDDMTLWNIHGQLARLIPVYAQAQRSKNINKVVRAIISNNYDQLILIKDDLLHPLPALELA